MSLNIEKERSVFRFQHQIHDLENNRFEVLAHDEFVEELGDYLLQLYLLNHREVAMRVIEKIGECTCNINSPLRGRALFILLGFAEQMEKEGGEELIKILTPFLSEAK